MTSRIALTQLAAALFCLSGLSSCVRSEKFDQRYAEAQCEQLAECGIFPDVDSCMQIIFGEPQETYRDQAIDAGRIDYNSRQARRCIRAVEALGCSRHEDESAVDEACAGIWSGTVQPDEPCLISDECQGELSVCAFSPSCNSETCCEGVCRYIPGPFAIGEPCEFADPCEADSFCRFPDMDTSQTGTCAPLAETGQACSTSSNCADAFYCKLGVCATLRTVGQSCQNAPCSAEYYCSSDTTCKVRGLEGEPCDGDDDDSCLNVDTICKMGTCVQRTAAGEPCDDFWECDLYATCNADICTAFAMHGEPCDAPCYPGLSCIYESCQRPSTGNVEICALPGAG